MTRERKWKGNFPGYIEEEKTGHRDQTAKRGQNQKRGGNYGGRKNDSKRGDTLSNMKGRK